MLGLGRFCTKIYQQNDSINFFKMKTTILSFELIFIFYIFLLILELF